MNTLYKQTETLIDTQEDLKAYLTGLQTPEVLETLTEEAGSLLSSFITRLNSEELLTLTDVEGMLDLLAIETLNHNNLTVLFLEVITAKLVAIGDILSGMLSWFMGSGYGLAQ